jgi:hypothetical protein
MRICRVVIEHFRGVPGVLTLDLSPGQAIQPVSLILAGDNGTGKSSIVDAIEFALQGHIAQSKYLKTLTAPSVPSFAVDELPRVSVTLDSGQVVTRGVIRDDEEGFLVTTALPHPGFGVSPFVLRRQDILRFMMRRRSLYLRMRAPVNGWKCRPTG